MAMLKRSVSVAIQCVPLDKQTFMYAAVAGEQRERVEKLRNQII